MLICVNCTSIYILGEIKALAGCDLLTISPKLLSELMESTETIERMLSPETGTYFLIMVFTMLLQCHTLQKSYEYSTYKFISDYMFKVKS